MDKIIRSLNIFVEVIEKIEYGQKGQQYPGFYQDYCGQQDQGSDYATGLRTGEAPS